ncbi:hypothetical protein G6F70_004547 [Rhizopus microsporus]|uniref:Uncharacterized protein n=1 Tax=Rhizopus microsporus TaxID=58291 RepID=A0A0A1NEZ4_RHIZD|nr:hypothetical protein G6F71_000249 [Rhizopus microsporus]KAG1199869.1 hypothetical protein G6F70_004547 [Rhizopus microsporus]KAG1211540.1 hypothetical protein G6F69_004496 [Rhizopus microsporus]KAG1233478.1 hypothetical protein G6F67_004232 [Rhizopus microsporus]KAG1262571.1 hypothetical protein G6F68_005838 [Rhizopus microsporus]
MKFIHWFILAITAVVATQAAITAKKEGGEICIQMIVPCPERCKKNCIYPDLPCPFTHPPKCPGDRSFPKDPQCLVACPKDNKPPCPDECTDCYYESANDPCCPKLLKAICPPVQCFAPCPNENKPPCPDECAKNCTYKRSHDPCCPHLLKPVCHSK